MKDPQTPPGPKHCLFCDERKLTMEHVWPKWILALFAPGAWDAAFGSGDGVRFPPMKTWETKNPERKARLVCARCNNGWMSEIEGATKPLLAGMIQDASMRRVLSAKDQNRLAIWAVLRAIVFDGVMPHKKQYYTDKERRIFALPEHEFPLNTSVWLAATLGMREGLLHVGTSVVGPDDPRGFSVTTGFIGQAVFQVFSWRGFPRTKLTIKGSPVIDLANLNSSAWRSSTRQILPPVAANASWPPPVRLGFKGGNEFGRRFIPPAGD